MNKLDKLAQTYGTDKWGKHHYTPFYYKLFKDRQQSVKKVVEMGAGEGAGLFMWRGFFPNAMIYSGEIEDTRLFETGRVKVIKCDQFVKEDLVKLIKETGSDIDLFVDDGSHIPEHQIFTCVTLMPLLDKGVIYIIEDVSDADILFALDDFNKYTCEIHRLGRRYDDRLIVVRHR